jgi:hypothetical protein
VLDEKNHDPTKVFHFHPTVFFQVIRDIPIFSIYFVLSVQARWTGLVLPSASEVYTFYIGGAPSTIKNERVKLWVDNRSVNRSDLNFLA